MTDRPGDKTFQFCVHGTYGFLFANLLNRWRNPYVLLDVGANIGLYSLIAAKSKMARRVIAFEPEPTSARFLRENISLNTARVDVAEAAVSSMSGKASLSSPEGHSGAARLDVVDGESDTVQVRTMAGVDLDNAIGPIPPGVDVIVKLDVEGHEFDALLGLQAWQHWEAVVAVWIELSERTDRAACLGTLAHGGFTARAHVGGLQHADVLFVRERLSIGRVNKGLPCRLAKHRCDDFMEAGV